MLPPDTMRANTPRSRTTSTLNGVRKARLTAIASTTAPKMPAYTSTRGRNTWRQVWELVQCWLTAFWVEYLTRPRA